MVEHTFIHWNETRMKRIQFRRAVCLLCKSNGNRIILFMRTQNVAIYVNSRRGGETKLKNVSVYRQTFITHSKRSCIWSILSNCATYLALTFCSCRTHRRYFKLFIDNFIDCSRTNAAFDDREEISWDAEPNAHHHHHSAFWIQFAKMFYSVNFREFITRANRTQ